MYIYFYIKSNRNNSLKDGLPIENHTPQNRAPRGTVEKNKKVFSIHHGFKAFVGTTTDFNRACTNDRDSSAPLGSALIINLEANKSNSFVFAFCAVNFFRY